MDTEREYQLAIKGNTLRFKTASYKSEMGSALHSGIYNRELTSSLVSGAIIVVASIAAVIMGVSIGLWHYALAAVLFIALTLLIRLYVLYEDYLLLTIDRQAGSIDVLVNSFIKKKINKNMDELTGVMKGLMLLAPKNADGIDIVKKVSLQHGMVIPGFGETKEYHTVNMEFGALATLQLFSTEDSQEAEAVLDVINKFVGGSPIAKTH